MVIFGFITPARRLRYVQRRLEQAQGDLAQAQLARINAEALIAAHTHEVQQLQLLLTQHQEALNAASSKG